MSFQSSKHSHYGSQTPFAVRGMSWITSTDVLSLGAEGSKVRTLQEALASKGYGICQTHTTGSKLAPHSRMESAKPWYTCTWKEGTFDAATKKAVEDFQGENGLKVDGKAGKNTFTKLGISLMPSPNEGYLPRVAPQLPAEVSKPDHPAVAAIQKYKWPVVGVTAAGVGYYVWWKFFRK